MPYLDEQRSTWPALPLQNSLQISCLRLAKQREYDWSVRKDTRTVFCRPLPVWLGKEASANSTLGRWMYCLRLTAATEHVLSSFVPILAKQIPYAVGMCTSRQPDIQD